MDQGLFKALVESDCVVVILCEEAATEVPESLNLTVILSVNSQCGSVVRGIVGDGDVTGGTLADGEGGMNPRRR